MGKLLTLIQGAIIFHGQVRNKNLFWKLRPASFLFYFGISKCTQIKPYLSTARKKNCLKWKSKPLLPLRTKGWECLCYGLTNTEPDVFIHLLIAKLPFYLVEQDRNILIFNVSEINLNPILRWPHITAPRPGLRQTI